jgi:hypothetical protein
LLLSSFSSKDIIFRTYLEFELEKKIIHFKSYISECEALVAELLLKKSNEKSDSTDKTSSSLVVRNSSSSLNTKEAIINDFINELENDRSIMNYDYSKKF